MWKVFPKLGLLKLLFSLFSALFLSVLIVLFSDEPTGSHLNWRNFGDILKIATPVSLAFIGLVFVVGKWGWKLIWNFPGIGPLMNKYACPNLNGIWRGTVKYLVADEQKEKAVKLSISADLFGINLRLISDDNYQSSDTVQSEMFRDPRTGAFYLSYVFESSMTNPEESDDREFDGAAKLKVILEESNTRLIGPYWTNRAWQRRRNTAGVLEVFKHCS